MFLDNPSRSVPDVCIFKLELRPSPGLFRMFEVVRKLDDAVRMFLDAETGIKINEIKLVIKGAIKVVGSCAIEVRAWCKRDVSHQTI